MKILMVCLGNICRSPVAEGILKHKVKEKGLDWTVDSSGTSGYHNGEAPDVRSTQNALKHGIDITGQRSSQFKKHDLDNYDLIFAMDQSNYQNIKSLATNDDQKEKVRMIMNMVKPGFNEAVPDPYYHDGFDRVFNMLDQACDAIIEQWGSDK